MSDRCTVWSTGITTTKLALFKTAEYSNSQQLPQWLDWCHNQRERMNTTEDSGSTSEVDDVIAWTYHSLKMKLEDLFYHWKYHLSISSSHLSVFGRDTADLPPPITCNTHCWATTITKAGVEKLLDNLKEHKTPGLDDLSPKLLLTVASEIAPILHSPVNFHLEYPKRVVPKDWTHARVSPISKKGDTSKAENYRPLSLTTILCKIMGACLVQPDQPAFGKVSNPHW